ncbi:MAG TPA: HAD family hydrolase [Aggregatilineales bacterium]|nr:HAD family hydrolase [Aggregatilineales bacterium]
MLKAIIFDLDGTLLDWRLCTVDYRDYERDHLGRVYAYVHNHIHPLNDENHFYDSMQVTMMRLWTDARNTMQAPHIGQVLVDTLEQHGVPRHLLDLDVCMQAFEPELIPGVMLFPDILAELDNLRRYGLRFGLATNASQPMSMRDSELKTVGLLDYFDDGCRLSAADAGYLKPHPQIFSAVMNNLGVAAEEAIFIGDNLEADIRGAQRVGMKAVLREYNEPFDPGVYSGAEIIPDAKIKTLRDLFPVLDVWYPGWRNGA